MSIFDVAAYTYRADVFHVGCIADAVLTGPGEPFDGWADATGTMDAEDFLDGIADAFGIDREDEYTFDSQDFPKAAFADQVRGMTCGQCGASFGGEHR